MISLFHTVAERLYQFKLRHTKAIMNLLIFIIIPTITGIAFGYEMGYNRIESIPIMIADYDHSEFSRTLSDYIADSEILTIKEYASSNEQVKDALDSGEVMAALIIPEQFNKDLLSGKGPKLEVLYDGAQMTVASAAKSALSEILLTVKAGYMKNIYQGKLSVVESESMKQIQPIGATYRVLFNPTKNYRNFLLPGMLAALMQVGFGIIGLSRSKEERCGFSKSIGKIIGWGLAGAGSMTICLGIQYLFFNLPYRGSLLAGALMTCFFAIAMTAFGFIMGRIVPDRVFATQLTCVLILPTSILSGYTFPVMAMPEPLQKLSILWPLTYYGDGIRSLCMKNIGLSYFIPHLTALGTIIAVELLFMACIVLVERKYYDYQLS